MKFAEQLKHAREQRGLTLADLAQRTHIRTDYLAALEAGDLSALPERTYTRAYVQQLARTLGLDPAPLLADFDAHVPRAASDTPTITRPTIRTRPRRALPTGLIAGTLSALLAVGVLGYFGYTAWIARPAQTSDATTPAPTAPATQVKLTLRTQPEGARVYLDNRFLGLTPVSGFPLDARDTANLRVEYGGFKTIEERIPLQRNVAYTVKLQRGSGTTALVPVTPPPPKPTTPVAATGTPTPDAVPTPAATPATGVRLTFTGRSWVRVTQAGRTLYEGIPTPGSTRDFPSGVMVRAGNPTAVQVSVNGQTAEAFGASASALTRTF
ncbi:helix-turn-helix domain-containing protein [Deinococcus maricopensis]|uniref:Transcriptional regulator, XRE family n=1 Tax=Deinococcus maricopensis (strain DSM 21211 / LMG 22137 / NRRL B-23946 / LB-34) TaxID=709986 RepID=E8UC40_DEIML|nr:helix-turn-helix domain-containing protein [Deinococcus maricopensis]ADV68701.1 transcriptional regulator, XRE family [Deinococcus maricopensis DSM 21211]